MENEKDIDFKILLQHFKENQKCVHIVLKNAIWLNGVVYDFANGNYVMITEKRNGLMAIPINKISKVELWKKQDG